MRIVCESCGASFVAENPDDVVECTACGRAIRRARQPEVILGPEGKERVIRAAGQERLSFEQLAALFAPDAPELATALREKYAAASARERAELERRHASELRQILAAIQKRDATTIAALIERLPAPQAVSAPAPEVARAEREPRTRRPDATSRLRRQEAPWLGLLIAAVVVAFGVWQLTKSGDPPSGPGVKPAPPSIAGAIAARPAAGRAPLSVRLAFEGGGPAPEHHAWTFGDGSKSNEAAPRHTFAAAGTYEVRLELQAGNATWTGTTRIVVERPPEAPRVEEVFAVPASGTAPLVVSLSARCTGSRTTYRWDFGDGTTAEGSTTSHAFRSAGTHHVTLTATNESGSHSGTTTVKVREPPPVAPRVPAIGVSAIRAEPRGGRAPLKVAFTPITTGDAVATYSWTFEDGDSSNEAGPTHTFRAAGTYEVRLRVKGAGGGQAEGYVKIVAEGPRTWTLGNSANADFRSLADALAACGDDDTIVVEPGEYRVGAQIESEGLKGLTIRAKELPPAGASESAFTSRFVSGATMIMFKHCERLRVEGLVFSGPPEVMQWNYLSVLSCNATTVKNCIFMHGGLGFSGIQGRCIGASIEYVRFKGKRLGPQSHSTLALHLWRVDDVVIRSCTADATNHSFYLPDVRNCRLENCRIKDCEYGLYVSDGSRLVTATNCDFRGARGPDWQIRVDSDLRGQVTLKGTKGKVTYD